ncbi:interferon gamma receptor 1-like isoform X2 [Dunckerocampus dactyliophorus]|uniref:interferon gamma receptor 1-like isoform X2 n=1 Tax=Dunckerocampus dactyliophorus TaxID=161453 RepID=UPI0024058FF3|nr:interferon gamma receptor 1-like isoform X2 [Dunckerocampus dactyliophorus]
MGLAHLKTLLVVFFALDITVAQVAPPSNVTLHCGNLQNKLVWSYDDPPPGLQFRVDVGQLSDSNGAIDPLWVDPPELQADVSFLSDPRNDYLLTVTAVLGENQSDPAPADGIVFSYYMDSPATQRCSLDLPPVTVLEHQDHTILLSFEHPWLFYHQRLPPALDSRRREKRRHKQPDNPLPVFKYDVTINKKQFADLSCLEQVCERKLPVDAAQEKHCVTIRGELEKISVHGTQDFCARPLRGNIVVVSVTVSLLVLAVVSAVLIMYCRKRTKATFSPPSLLDFTDRPHSCTMSLVQETPDVPKMGFCSTSVQDEALPDDPTAEPDSPFSEDSDGDVAEEQQEEEEGYMGGENLENYVHESENAYERRCDV